MNALFSGEKILVNRVKYFRYIFEGVWSTILLADESNIKTVLLCQSSL